MIGASGGIGRALVDALASRADVRDVRALSRTLIASDHPKISPGTLDICNEDSVRDAAGEIAAGEAPDLIIVASGILSDGAALQPEKSYRQQDAEAFQRVFAVNTIGPALVAKHLLPLLPRDRRAVFAALSARVGSISDNRLGGWHAYRASKAALNMLIRNYALELARTHKQAVCVGLHPGTVDTALSAPFQSNVAPEKLFSPAQSAGYLLHVLGNLTPEQSGRVFDWAGKAIPA